MVLQRQDILGPQSLADLCSLASLRIPKTKEHVVLFVQMYRGGAYAQEKITLK